MLAKKYRLPVHEALKIRGQMSGNGFFSVKISRNHLNFDRFGVVIGTKIRKKATARNRLRRMIFNLLRGIYGNKKNDRGSDILIVARPPVASLSDKEAVACLRELLRI